MMFNHGFPRGVKRDLVVLCAGNPQLNDAVVDPKSLDVYDRSGYIGSNIRYDAAALMIAEEKFDKIILVGGGQKSLAMKQTIKDRLRNIFSKSQNEPTMIEAIKFVCLQSDPDTTGNAMAALKYYSSFTTDPIPTQIVVLTNTYHCSRAQIIFDSLPFFNGNTIYQSAEQYIKNSTCFTNRKDNEAKGIEQWKKRTYKDHFATHPEKEWTFHVLE